jgi:murein hydrolase activator
VRSIFRIFFVFAFLFPIVIYSFGQSSDKSALEKRKEETLKQIEITRKLLDQTRKSAVVTLNQVTLLNKNISNREKLINELDYEIKVLQIQIVNNEAKIKEYEKSIQQLKKEYEKIILATHRNLEQESYMEYILGAQDINQSYHRLKQIKYINEYRKKVYDQLVLNKELSHAENLKLEAALTETKNAMKLKEKEIDLLSREKGDKQKSVSKLQTQERKLLAEIKEKQDIQKKIEQEINRLIEEEIKRAKARNVELLTPSEQILSNDFVKNRGRLPWPVERGVITAQFGEHKHPVIKDYTTTSIGVDINTVEGEKVKCIFEGEVTRILPVMGSNYVVMVKHGEFYTVYANLINITVKVGEKIKRNHFIGTLYTDKQQSTKLHFQIWKDRTPQDPELWLSK